MTVVVPCVELLGFSVSLTLNYNCYNDNLKKSRIVTFATTHIRSSQNTCCPDRRDSFGCEDEKVSIMDIIIEKQHLLVDKELGGVVGSFDYLI